MYRVPRLSPYSSTAGQANSSVAVSTTTYDPVGRPYVATDASGATSQYTYVANDTLVTLGPAPAGEHSKSRQLESKPSAS
jgi:YD repeat-containing protein